jgi:hypothetical protein
MKEVENVKIIVRDVIIATLGRVHWGRNLMLGLLHEKIIFLGSKARPTRKADNLTAIFEPTV